MVPIITCSITSMCTAVPGMGVNVFGLVIGLLFLHVYGTGDLSRVKLIGDNFKVGYKEYHVRQNGCAVSVFYPIDKDVPDFVRTTGIIRYGKKQIYGFKKAVEWYTGSTLPIQLIRHFDDIKMDVQ